MKHLLLTLSLLASPLAAQPASQEQSLRTFLQALFERDREAYPDTRVVTAWADLNGDGRPEALVYVMSGNYCGSGGCTLMIFTSVARTWRAEAVMSVTNPPILLLLTSRHGWRDIAVSVAGGGARAHEALMAYQRGAYPSNPTVPPARALRRAVPGRVLIADGDRGRPIF